MAERFTEAVTTAMAAGFGALLLFIAGIVVYTLQDLRASNHDFHARILALEAWRQTIERRDKESRFNPRF